MMIGPSPITGKTPKIHRTAFVSEDAVIIGDVEIGPYANIWPGAKIRGDRCKIVIGGYTSVQENVVIHSEPGTECIIGSYIIIGHLAMVHGPCKVGDYAMIGLGSTVLQGSEVGEGAVIAGGAVLRGKADKYSLYAGVPAVKKKDYGEKRIELGKAAAEEYAEAGRKFAQSQYAARIPGEYLFGD